MVKSSPSPQSTFLGISFRLLPRLPRRSGGLSNEAEPVVAADAGSPFCLYSGALGPARLHSALGGKADAPSPMRYFRWIIGAILCFCGGTMLIGYLGDQFSGESTTSWYFNLGFAAAIGLVPLSGGLMLLLMRPGPFSRSKDPQ